MLRYESTGRVSAAAARAIRRDLEGIRRDWWRGVLGLDASEEGRPSVLEGRTALFHRGSIPDAEDLLMAFADTVFILEVLGGWARRHRIKWRIRMQDEEWGAVDPTGWTPVLADQMGKWASRVGASPAGRHSWQVAEDRRAALLARYAARKET